MIHEDIMGVVNALQTHRYQMNYAQYADNALYTSTFKTLYYAENALAALAEQTKHMEAAYIPQIEKEHAA